MDIKKVISEMTLEEKAGLLSGQDFWHTKAVERLGVPAVMVSDGPHGLRKQAEEGDHLGVNDSIKAVCYPPACAAACSFDRAMIRKVGESIGESCQHEGLAVDPGPAVNIKRSPLCGRNFEYQSEDPYLAGEMAAAEVQGIQSRNVGTSVKHFAANDQEHRRNTCDSVVDERTLREIYLKAFEIIVKKAQPWTIMCSYNKLNGEQVSEDRWLLTDVLRNEWGFKGLVVSDWGAVRDRVKGVHAGLDLEMPSSGGFNDAQIVNAVMDGRLPESEVDTAVERVLTLVDRYERDKKPETPWDMEAEHRHSAEAEEDCAVLLRNENMELERKPGLPQPFRKILPLDRKKKIVFVGEFAEHPRFQGGGSSHINCFRVESALDAAREDGLDITYARGYDAAKTETDETLLNEALQAALDADVAVVFAGLPESAESEGYDRSTMGMPENQNTIISTVASVCANTVVVLHHGAPVEMPWADDKNVRGIIDMYLGGQAVGRAEIDLLYGRVSPSGRLAESVPFRLGDNPSCLYFGGEGDRTEYREGVFVGYRYYTKKQMPVRYPFGFGLSYAKFAFSDLRIDSDHMKAGGELTVSVDVTNRGGMEARQVVQLYVGKAESRVIRPVRELKGFDKVSLKPFEKTTVTFRLDDSAFAYWNTEIHDWYVESGEYTIAIGESCEDMALETTVTVTNDRQLPKTWDDNTTIGDILDDPEAKQVAEPLIRKFTQNSVFGGGSEEGQSEAASAAITDEMMKQMMGDMALRQLISFGSGMFTPHDMHSLIDALNEMQGKRA
ncbi:MAG: glycoside hydrolase family 3 C-terminal domain-containing protein [Lachnospiraceae bacterium]|jgi:beta-glucosidase|nr:glycoside hydrolase family 3 C-terminal domain-containing protein [Lachnospiraceae bacterium]